MSRRSKAALAPQAGPEAKRIVLLVFPPFREPDVIAPIEVFSTANRLAGGKKLYQVTLLSTGPGARVEGMSGLSFSCDGECLSYRGGIDTLLVPGGLACEQRTPPRKVISWLREAASKTRRVGSIGTGAFLLAETGLLKNRRVTTHWAHAKKLKEAYPEIAVDPNPIWVKDGNIYTSAGASSGIDLALTLVEEDHGAGLALKVARDMVVFLRRPGTQAQCSATLELQSNERNPFRELAVWIAEHLAEDLKIPNLAQRIGMSPRNFYRAFAAATGKSPASFVEELRVEAAQRQIEKSPLSLEEIANACGFRTANSMRRGFLRVLAETPGDCRNRIRMPGILG